MPLIVTLKQYYDMAHRLFNILILWAVFSLWRTKWIAVYDWDKL